MPAVAGLMLALTPAAAVAGAGSRDEQDTDLREGGVYTMTNDRKANRVVAFARGDDGRLTRAGSFATGGTGSGSFEDTNNAMILGSDQGEAAPNNLIEEAPLLFVTNARSNEVNRLQGAQT